MSAGLALAVGAVSVTVVGLLGRVNEKTVQTGILAGPVPGDVTQPPPSPVLQKETKRPSEPAEKDPPVVKKTLEATKEPVAEPRLKATKSPKVSKTSKK